MLPCTKEDSNHEEVTNHEGFRTGHTWKTRRLLSESGVSNICTSQVWFYDGMAVKHKKILTLRETDTNQTKKILRLRKTGTNQINGFSFFTLPCDISELFTNLKAKLLMMTSHI